MIKPRGQGWAPTLPGVALGFRYTTGLVGRCFGGMLVQGSRYLGLMRIRSFMLRSDCVHKNESLSAPRLRLITEVLRIGNRQLEPAAEGLTQAVTATVVIG